MPPAMKALVFHRSDSEARDKKRATHPVVVDISEIEAVEGRETPTEICLRGRRATEPYTPSST